MDARSTIRYRVDATIFLIVVYLFWIFTTPIYSNRLEFLAAHGFEKALAGTLAILVIVSGRHQNLFDTVTLLCLVLFFFMIVSDFTSVYPDNSSVYHWRESYWKRLVFLGIITMGVRKWQHLHQVLKGMILVIFFYQAYSWFDFLRGGSFVYQQGMKRMCGTWSGGGIGAANAFGALSAFALPFYRYWFQTAIKERDRAFAVLGGCVSLLSIIFSGTRGALVVALAFLVFTFRRSLFRPKFAIVLALLAIVLIPILPEEYRHRYWDLLVRQTEGELSKTDQMAVGSAKGRIQGMVDGFELGMQNPLFGVGPERSAAARHELRLKTDSLDPEYVLQLHNLYGQIIAELGIFGFALWLSIVIRVLHVILSMKCKLVGNYVGAAACDALLGGMLVSLTYGMCSHSLYDWRWMILFGCTVGLRNVDWDFGQQVDN